MHVRRTLAVTLLALAVGLPAAAGAAAPSKVTWGFGLGMEDGDGDTGLALRADAIFPFKALSPAVKLSWVGSAGFTYFSDSDLDYSLSIIKAVPAARFSFPLSPSFELYGDVGFGLYMAFLSAGTFDDTEFSFLMRFAVGGLVTVSPTVRLGAELGLNPYFGDIDDNTFSALFVAKFGY